MKHSFLSIVSALAFGALVAHAEVAPLSGSSKVKFEELPSAVQNAAKAQAGSSAIEDAEKGTLNGKTVYEIAFKRDGQHTELRVGEDGSIVDTIVAGQSAGTTGALGQTAATETQTDVYGAGFGAHLSGATKVSFDQLPENVKHIVREASSNAAIEDIDKGTMGSVTVYQAAYKKGGQHAELRVTENGKRVREVINGKTTYAHEPITLAKAPEKVRSTVKSRLGNTPITSALSAEGKSGKLYRFFYNKGGKHHELRVWENGTKVQDLAVAGPMIREGAGAPK